VDVCVRERCVCEREMYRKVEWVCVREIEGEGG